MHSIGSEVRHISPPEGIDKSSQGAHRCVAAHGVGVFALGDTALGSLRDISTWRNLRPLRLAMARNSAVVRVVENGGQGSKHSVATSSPGGTLMNFRSAKTRRFDKEMGAIEKDRLCQVLKKDVRGNAKQFWDALKSASLQHFESTDAAFMAFASPSDCMMSLEQFQELSEYLGFALTFHSAKNLFEQKVHDREMNAMTLQDFQDACIVAPLDRIRARLRGHRQNMLACAFHIDNFIRHLSLYTGENHRRRAVTRFQQKLTTRFCMKLWSNLQQWAERKTAGEPMISKETFLKMVDSIQSFQAYEMEFFGNIYERVDRGQKGEVVMFDLAVTILLMATSNSRCDKAKLIFTVFDTDGDGCLSSEQLLKMYCSLIIHAAIARGDQPSYDAGPCSRSKELGALGHFRNLYSNFHHSMAAMAPAFVAVSQVSPVASAGRFAAPSGATGATGASSPAAVADETGSHPKFLAAAALLVTLSVGKRGRRAAAKRAKVLRRATNIFERSSLEAGAKLLEEAVKSSNGSNPTEFTSFSEEKNRQSYVSQQAALEGLEDVNGVDDDGLPLVYSVERIAKFWDTKPGELAERWSRFLRISTPFITRFFYSLLNLGFIIDVCHEVPSWAGDPADFETFATACRWFERSLKDNERKAAASRVWAKLSGPAKAVVRHLDPDQYEGTDGLSRLVDVLRKSPLQALPGPDLFKRLDQWHQLKRNSNESIPQFLVREEDMFVQLQDALKRARKDSHPDPTPEVQRGPPSTPSQSPIGRGAPRTATETEPSAGHATSAGNVQQQQMGVTDFFGDELRGYRLSKGSRLTTAERQNILVQTSNSTAFFPVRRALRTLFSDEDDGWRKPRVWWNDETLDGWEHDEMWQDGAHDPGHYAWWHGDETYYDDGASWNAYYDDDWNEDWEWEESEDVPVDEQTADPTEVQYKEAFALANEATRTLNEAREAVRKVRAARGYFAPESASGKGISGSPTSSRSSWSPKGSSGKGKFSGAGKGKGFGPCFICGMKGHSYAQCPDRFSKGKGQSKSKGFVSKGKSKKGKGFSKSVQYHDLSCLAFPGVYLAEAAAQQSRVILDTGASENAVGMESLQRLVTETNAVYEIDTTDKPVFRFGNGQHLQASSRVDIHNTSLGSVSFYVLGGDACLTPPLMGGKTLRAYQNNLLLYQRQDPQPQWFAVKMHSHASNHVSIDLMESAVEMKDPGLWFVEGSGMSLNQHVSTSTASPASSAILMMSNAGNSNLSNQLATLAQRLQALRQRQVREHGTTVSSMCGRRSTPNGLSMLWPAQDEAKAESACNMADTTPRSQWRERTDRWDLTHI
eukprot:s60_g6.t1